MNNITQKEIYKEISQKDNYTVNKYLYMRGENIKKNPFARLPFDVVKIIANIHNTWWRKRALGADSCTIYKNPTDLINKTFEIFEKFRIATDETNQDDVKKYLINQRRLVPVPGYKGYPLKFDDNFKFAIRKSRNEPNAVILAHYSMMKTTDYRNKRIFKDDANDVEINQEKILVKVDKKGAHFLMENGKTFYTVADFLHYLIKDLHSDLEKFCVAKFGPKPLTPKEKEELLKNLETQNRDYKERISKLEEENKKLDYRNDFLKTGNEYLKIKNDELEKENKEKRDLILDLQNRIKELENFQIESGLSDKN